MPSLETFKFLEKGKEDTIPGNVDQLVHGPPVRNSLLLFALVDVCSRLFRGPNFEAPTMQIERHGPRPRLRSDLDRRRLTVSLI